MRPAHAVTTRSWHAPFTFMQRGIMNLALPSNQLHPKRNVPNFSNKISKRIS
jgi:hypothetical protein